MGLMHRRESTGIEKLLESKVDTLEVASTNTRAALFLNLILRGGIFFFTELLPKAMIWFLAERATSYGFFSAFLSGEPN